METKATNTTDDLGHLIFDPVNFRIDTPPIKALKKEIIKLVWTNALGAAVIGFSQAGKSVAITQLDGCIKDRNGGIIPIEVYSVHRRDRNTILALYYNIGNYLGLPVANSRDVERMSGQILSYFAEMAWNNKTNKVILFVDEAQRLKINQLDLFAELQDKLKIMYGVLLIIVYVGNKEQLSTLLNKISRGENQHLEGRYFLRSIEFHGLKNAREVAACLKQYDNMCDPKTGLRLTEYFLEEEFNKGFRLENISNIMWGVFKDYKKQYKLNSWGMGNFICSVNLLLTDYLPRFPHDDSGEQIRQMVIKSIMACKLGSDLVRVVKEK